LTDTTNHHLLISDLIHGSPRKRKHAAKQLQRIANQQAVSALSQVLYDENLTVRLIALETLFYVHDVRAVDALISLLYGTEEEWCAGKDVWQRICNYHQAFISPKQHFQETSSEMGLLKNEWIEIQDIIVERLNAMVYSEQELVRYRIIDVLGRMNNKRAADVIITALKDAHTIIRSQAARMLAPVESKHRNLDVVEPLIEVLITDGDPQVRADAALSLGLLLDARATEPLITTLLSDKESFVRGQAAGALGNLGSQNAISALIEALDDSAPFVRMWAIYSLTQHVYYDHESVIQAVPALIELLSDTDADVRREATIALGTIGDKQAVKPLITVLEHVQQEADITIVCSTIEALGKLRDTRAINVLQDMLDLPLNSEISNYIQSVKDLVVQTLVQIRTQR
jgi:HEAT repeat protein